MISVNCGACGKSYSLKPETAGKTFVCQLCNNKITIPSVLAYGGGFDRETPGYFIFLLDQSGSMNRPVGGGEGVLKSDALADNLNSWIDNLLVMCAGSSGILPYLDVSVIGYSTDDGGGPIIEPALVGPLAGRERVGIDELAQHPAREEETMQQFFDEEPNEIVEVPYTHRIWVEPKASYGAPMSSALVKAYELADEWTQQHPDSLPPIVINFSDGESIEGDPRDDADSLKSISTNDGNVLLLNCQLSEMETEGIVFPSSSTELLVTGDPHAQTLFDISSVIPETMLESGKALGFDLSRGAHCMAFNAEAVGFIRFFEVGSRLFPRDIWGFDNRKQ